MHSITEHLVVAKELSSLINRYLPFVSLPKLCDQAVGINRSSRNYKPTPQMEYAILPHAVFTDSLLWSSVTEFSRQLPVAACSQRKKFNAKKNSSALKDEIGNYHYLALLCVCVCERLREKGTFKKRKWI